MQRRQVSDRTREDGGGGTGEEDWIRASPSPLLPLSWVTPPSDTFLAPGIAQWPKWEVTLNSSLFLRPHIQRAAQGHLSGPCCLPEQPLKLPWGRPSSFSLSGLWSPWPQSGQCVLCPLLYKKGPRCLFVHLKAVVLTLKRKPGAILPPRCHLSISGDLFLLLTVGGGKTLLTSSR